MKLKAFLLIAVLSMFVISCSKDDDNNSEALSISFTPGTYNTAFYVAGETEAGTVTSNIGDPEISVSAETDPSITYNNATGRVEWTEELPLGENVVTVVAAVGSREATTDIIIDNAFQGSFTGGYNFNVGSMNLTSLNYTLQFNSDGTLMVDDDGNMGEGTWTRDGSAITASYDFGGATPTTIQANVSYNSMEAFVAGTWYSGASQGYFRVDINQ